MAIIEGSYIKGLMRGFAPKALPVLKGGGMPLYSELQLCDIGLNLSDPMFRGVYNSRQCHPDDLELVLARALSMGVSRSILTGTTIEDSIESLQLVRKLEPQYGLYSTAGIHPTRCSVFQDEDSATQVISQLSEVLEEGMNGKNVVAIGECGLDYDRLQFCDKDTQKKGFIHQLQLTSRFELPFFFHNRNTNGDFLDIVRYHQHLLVKGGVVHSFDGSLEEAEAFMKLGLFIGVNGCSLKSEESLRVVKAIPLEFLLLETDSPWCSIKPSHASEKFMNTVFSTKKKDKYESGFLVKDRGEPCMLVQVLEVVAALKSISPAELAEITYRNSVRLFFS